MAIAEGRRIAVILEPDIDASLRTIAGVTGQPVATVLRELLREAAPGLHAYAKVLAVAQESPKKAAAMMVREMDRQTVDLVQASLPLRAKRGRKPKG